MKKFITVAMAAGIILFIHASVTPKEKTDKAKLGERLFFDPILSKDSTVSCASCHRPDHAFADTGAVSRGVAGRKGSRNTPTAMNLSLQHFFFWDGRAATLEQQALAPIENKDEMNLPVEKALLRLRNHKVYNELFSEIYKRQPTAEDLADAIATFERTLETYESSFDEWKFSGDPKAVSEGVKRGFALFNGKAKCIKCHFGADFTTNEFRNIGLFNGRQLNDSGRAVVTGKKTDIGKFKVAGLRNVAITAPYMHNGMFKTLGQVIDFYNDPGKRVPHSINRDSLLLKPLGLTYQEKKDLEVFLISLTDKQFVVKKSNASF